MSNLNSQLERLMPNLSGRERAILVLRTFKDGKQQDQRLARGMSQAESQEYNRLMRLLNVCNTELVSLIVALKLSVDGLQVRLGWLVNVTMYEIHAEELNKYLAECTRELVTRSEFSQLERQARESYTPVQRFAFALTSLKEDWPVEDLEDAENCVVKPEAWEPVEAAFSRELTALAKEGVLEAKGRGTNLKVTRESFYAWRGLDVPVLPEWGADYDVRPDSETDFVLRQREHRATVRKSLQQLLNPEADDNAPFWLLPARRLPKELERGVKSYWSELRALEVVLDEIAQEFGGEDVLKPITREDLVKTRQKALNIQTVIQDWVEPFELPETNEEDVRQTRDLIYKWADNRR